MRLSAVHYKDIYPKSFQAFRAKYLKLLKQPGSYHYYVQFTNFQTDVLERKPYETPDHHDPAAIYAYPLAYVLKHPADIWYGNKAKFLRVLKQRKSTRTLSLQSLNWSEARNILFKMGLPDDALDKATLLWPHRIGKGQGSIGRAFFQAVQMDTSNIEKVPRRLQQRDEVAKTARIRSAKEQTALFRKAGYDAIEDTARNQKTAVINPREPEQIALFHRQAFDVVEVIPLNLKVTTTGVGTSQDMANLAPKLAAKVAEAINDKLLDREHLTFWTKAGREIIISFDRPQSYYEGKKLGEKKHKEAKLSDPHYTTVTLNSERGTIIAGRSSTETFDEIAGDLAYRFNQAPINPDFKPITKKSRQEEKEAAKRAYYAKEREKKTQKLATQTPDVLAEIEKAAQKLNLPFTHKDVWNSSDQQRDNLDTIITIAGRYFSDETYKARRRLEEQGSDSWDWYSSYDKDTTLNKVSESLANVLDDQDPEATKELLDIYSAAIDWMLEHKTWAYQAPSGFFYFLNRHIDEHMAEQTKAQQSQPTSARVAKVLLAVAEILSPESKLQAATAISGYLVKDVSDLKNYLQADSNTRGKELARLSWDWFRDFVKLNAVLGFNAEDMDPNDPKKGKLNIDSLPDWIYGMYWVTVIKNEDLEKVLTLTAKPVSPAHWPTFFLVDFVRLVKNEWLIHFTKNPGLIRTNGFTKGISDITKLGVTTQLEKTGPGFNFAYLASEAPSKEAEASQIYGDQAVMFKANGVRTFHKGDKEEQTIFLGSTAKDIVQLSSRNTGWVVLSNDFKPLFNSKKTGAAGLKLCIDWVEKNYNQYKNKITKERKPAPATQNKSDQKLAASTPRS